MTGLELDHPVAVNSRANTMRDFCQRPKQALADYERAIELAPFWAEPYYERALLYESEGDPDRALADLEKAVELAPNWTEAVEDLSRHRGSEGA